MLSTKFGTHNCCIMYNWWEEKDTSRFMDDDFAVFSMRNKTIVHHESILNYNYKVSGDGIKIVDVAHIL